MKTELSRLFDSNHFFKLFADAVRTKRQEADVTQLELINILKQKEIKVSQAYLSQIEAGQRKEPSARIVIALAAALDINCNDLIEESRIING
jgi:transcriptional regulator with XRE-family HTH domain